MIDIWKRMEEESKRAKAIRPPVHNGPSKKELEEAQRAFDKSQAEYKTEQENALKAENAVKEVMLKTFRDMAQNLPTIKEINPRIFTKKYKPGELYYSYGNVSNVELTWGSLKPGEKRKSIICRIGSAMEIPVWEDMSDGYVSRGVHIYGGSDNDEFAHQLGYKGSCFYVGSNYNLPLNHNGKRSYPRGFNLYPSEYMGLIIPNDSLYFQNLSTPFENKVGMLLNMALSAPLSYQNPYSQDQLDEIRRKEAYVHEELSRQATFVSDNSHETGCS